ncbi:MAG: serine dehydratase, partial [Cytophagales bacterium]|nr:serine dehydratase [Cytophagales bacterium]
MAILFENFRSWGQYCADRDLPLYAPVLEYEIEQKGRSETEIWDGLQRAWT